MKEYTMVYTAKITCIIKGEEIPEGEDLETMLKEHWAETKPGEELALKAAVGADDVKILDEYQLFIRDDELEEGEHNERDQNQDEF